MKKVIALCLVLAIGLSLCACSGGGKKLSIVDNNGAAVSLSVKELEKIRDTDGRQWSNYKGAAVSGSGKITDITNVAGTGKFYADSSVVRNGKSYEYKYVEVTIDDEIVLLTRRETFVNFYVGDTVSFEGEIVEGASTIWFLIDCCGENDYDNPELNISLQ